MCFKKKIVKFYILWRIVAKQMMELMCNMHCAFAATAVGLRIQHRHNEKLIPYSLKLGQTNRDMQNEVWNYNAGSWLALILLARNQ